MSGGAGSASASDFSSAGVAVESRAVGKYLQVSEVHNDDIHGICITSRRDREGSQQIISGSKDGTVKKFNAKGVWKANLSRHPDAMHTEARHSYKNWVTALDLFPDDSFVAGHRNSYFLSRSADALPETFFSQKISNLPEMKAPADSKVSASSRRGGAFGSPRGRGAGSGASAFRGKFYKVRNEERITGVKCVFDALNGYRVLIGLPEKFLELDCATRRVIKKYQFSKSEWVYGFARITPVLMVAIHGCALSLFQDREDHWDLLGEVVSEDKKLEKAAVLLGKASGAGAGAGEGALCASVVEDEKSLEGFMPVIRGKSRAARPYSAVSSAPGPKTEKQRPYISSVLSCLNPSHLALSFFGGLNQILDVETKSVIHQGFEHSERVWQAVPLPGSDAHYATCADDKTIKIWDVRAGMASVMTYRGHPGRVSALAFLDENKLVAGTCADNPWTDPEKGQFWFYDLRGGF
jgi:hypothetical protein